MDWFGFDYLKIEKSLTDYFTFYKIVKELMFLPRNYERIGTSMKEEYITEILNYVNEGLTLDQLKIMYQGLNIINDRLNSLCEEYDSRNIKKEE